MHMSASGVTILRVTTDALVEATHARGSLRHQRRSV